MTYSEKTCRYCGNIVSGACQSAEEAIKCELPPWMSGNSINHPPHYGGEANPYEAIKVIEAWELNFLIGNTVKYLCRAGKKGPILPDLQKARWYLDREIARLSAQEDRGLGVQGRTESSSPVSQSASQPPPSQSSSLADPAPPASAEPIGLESPGTEAPQRSFAFPEILPDSVVAVGQKVWIGPEGYEKHLQEIGALWTRPDGKLAIEFIE